MKSIKDYILTIPNFPKEGIMFRDITSLLQNADGFNLAINLLKEKLENIDFDVIAGTESRGFIFGAPLAYALHKPFIPVRKKGKLPREVISKEYDLEYGKEIIEIHKDSITKGDKIVLIDDLIATGGTIKATAELLEQLGGDIVKILFIIELLGLNGRELLKEYDVDSLVKYEGI